MKAARSSSTDAAVLLQPGKALLDDPALGHDLEGVQLAAPVNLYADMFSKNVPDRPRKGQSCVAAVTWQILYSLEAGFAARYQPVEKAAAMRIAGKKPRKVEEQGAASASLKICNFWNLNIVFQKTDWYINFSFQCMRFC